MADTQKVSTSTRQFSEEVAIAEASSPLPRLPVVYEFAGGKRLFTDHESPYEP
jgi:hypothetical protein